MRGRPIANTPLSGDGLDGLRSYIKWISANCPNPKGEIKSVFADGDFVILHVDWTGLFVDSGDAVVDLFRLENGSWWNIGMSFSQSPERL